MFFLISQNNPKLIFENFKNIEFSLILISILLTLQMPVIQAFRLKLIFESVNLQLNFKRLVTVIAGSYPLISVTPSRSGDFVRSYYLRKEVDISESASSVISEKIFDIFSLLILSSIALLTLDNFGYNILALILFLAILFLTYLAAFNPTLPLPKNLSLIIYKLLNSYSHLLKKKKLFFKVFVISLFQWSLALLQTFVFFLMIKVDVSLFFTFALAPLAIFLGQLPITLGGMGTRDFAFINLFRNYVTETELLSVGILFSAYRYWFLSLIGIPFMWALVSEYGDIGGD